MGDDANTPDRSIKDGAQPADVVKGDDAPPPSDAARDKLVSKLATMGVVDRSEPEEDKEPDPDPVKDEEPAKNDDPELVKDAEPDASPETGEETAGAAEVAEPTDEDVIAEALAKAEKPPENTPAEGHLPPADYRRLSKEGKAAIEALRSKRKESDERLAAEQPWSEYGKKIGKVLDENGIADEDFNQWVHLGTVVAKGGEQAVNALIGMATALGYKPPAAHQESRPAWVKDMLDKGDIDEVQASAIEARIKADAAAKAPAPPPPPAARSTTERPDGMRERAVKANADLESFDSTMKSKYGERAWKVLREEMKAEVKTFAQGVPPERWVACYEKALELVVAKHRAKSRKTAPRSLAATTSTPVKVDALSGRKRVEEMARRGLLNR